MGHMHAHWISSSPALQTPDSGTQDVTGITLEFRVSGTIQGLYGDTGKGNGSYCLGFRVPGPRKYVKNVAFLAVTVFWGSYCWTPAIPVLLQVVGGV